MRMKTLLAGLALTTALTAPAVPCTWTAPATLADQATAPASAVPQAQPAPDAPTTTEPPPRYRVVGVAQPDAVGQVLQAAHAP